jgi:poly-gamma-glutamate synthesis protein (capsule biosynthesis protein)
MKKSVKRIIAILFLISLLISVTSCKKKDDNDSNISNELASEAQVYTYMPNMAATDISDDEMFSYIAELNDMLKSISSSGCNPVTLKNVKDYGMKMQSYRFADSPLADLIGYAGDIVEGVVNYRYRIYKPTEIYQAYANYKTAFKNRGSSYSAYKAMPKLTLNQAMLSCYLVGNRDYNTNAVTVAGGISFTPTHSGVTFDRVWASVGGYVGYPFENMQSVFFSDYKTMVALNTIMTDADVERKSDNAYYSTGEYINMLKEQTIDYVMTDTTHMLDYGTKGKSETESLLSQNGLQCVNSGTICKGLNYEAVSTVISGNFENKENNPTYLTDIATMVTNSNNEGEFVIVYAHFGEKSDTEYKKKVARFLIDSGAGIVIGLDEGNIDGVELYNGKYIFYNIAPLINGGNTDMSVKYGLSLQLVLQKQNGRTNLADLILIPFSVNSNYGENWNNFQPTPIFEKKLDKVIQNILNKSQKYDYPATQLHYFKTTQ